MKIVIIKIKEDKVNFRDPQITNAGILYNFLLYLKFNTIIKNRICAERIKLIL